MQNKTNIDFKVFLLQHGITIRELADNIGLKPRSVTNQLVAGKKLPTWAKTMMYGYELNNNKNPWEKLKELEIKAFEQQEKNNIYLDLEYNCGCKHEGKLFRRAKGCKIEIKEHRV